MTRSTFTILSGAGYPLAFRHWRRRYGWESGAEYLYLTLPLVVSDDSWRSISTLIRVLSRDVPLDPVARHLFRLPLFPIGKIGKIPAENVNSILETLHERVPRLLPLSMDLDRVLIAEDRLTLVPDPDLENFRNLRDIWRDIAPATGPVDHYPLLPQIDLAYCAADAVWPDLSAGPSEEVPPINVSANLAEISVVFLREEDYEFQSIDRIEAGIPDAIQTGRNDSRGGEAHPRDELPSPAELSGSTALIWHVNHDFAFHLNSELDNHALLDFLHQASDEVQAEYLRIQRRVREDPGTAGDEGESNWQEVLENWLPASLHVETKGRLLGRKGEVSPQLDIFVLEPDYPRALRKKKLFFAEGVVATFECKLTLRARHFPSIVESARAVANIGGSLADHGSKHAESRIAFGVLAHSSEWGQGDFESFEKQLRPVMAKHNHPGEAIDFFCVADNYTWTHGVTKFGKGTGEGSEVLYRVPPGGSIHSQYLGWTTEPRNSKPPISPLYILIWQMWRRLSDLNADYTDFAAYLRAVPLPGVMGRYGVARSWPGDIIRE